MTRSEKIRLRSAGLLVREAIDAMEESIKKFERFKKEGYDATNRKHLDIRAEKSTAFRKSQEQIMHSFETKTMQLLDIITDMTKD
tara:strand:- start:12169 stop:12423 length:255 start_codon:yes stop_codon:yes gene_type:complete